MAICRIKKSCFLVFYGCLPGLLLPCFLLASPTDSLQALLRQAQVAQNSSESLRLTLELADACFSEKNFPQAIALFQAAQNLANQQTDWGKYQEALFGLGKTHEAAGNFFQAIQTCRHLIDHIHEKKTGRLAEACTQLSEAYQGVGNNELAFDYQLQALHLHKLAGDSTEIARSLYNIGTIFFYQDNYALALDYYQQTLQWCEAMRSQRHVFSALAAIGSAHNRLGEVEKSLEYNLRSLKIAEALDYKTGLSYALQNVGADYVLLKNYDRALAFFFQSLQLKKDLNDAWGEAGNQRLIGDAYLKKGDFVASLKHLNASLALAEQMNSKPRLVEIYRALANYHERTGDFRQSNDFLHRYEILKDSLASEAALQKMSDTKNRYEILEKEEALKKKEREMQRLVLYALVGGVALLAFSFWLLFLRYREHVKNNRLLSAKNQQIQAQNEELAQAFRRQREAIRKIEEQFQLLEQSNGDLQRFAYVASHDLKEPLRTIGSYANLLQKRYARQMGDEADEFLNFITGGVKRLYNLLNDILTYSKLDSDEGQDWVDLQAVAIAVRQNLREQIAEKNALVQVGRLPKVRAKEAHLVQLIQNLVANGLKYCDKSRPEIWLDCRQKGAFFQFSVRDNGIGIEPAFREKIFELFQRLHGREQYEGTGIGLAICKKIVRQYGGSIWVESEAGKGSVFYFTLPVGNQAGAEMEKELEMEGAF